MQLPDFSLANRVALVTGAARGIGLAIARGFAGAGASVVIQDIEQPLAEREAADIVAAGGQAIGIGGDAIDVAHSGQWIDQTVARFGGLHILVNNASIQTSGDFFDASIDDMRRQFDANVLTLAHLCTLAIPHMQAAKWGRILNIGSIQGLKGNGWMAPYAMTKAAVHNLTHSLARRFGPNGITVNCIAPGMMNTYRNREQFQTEAQKKDNSKNITLRRTGEPEDCVGPALLLCSEAGSYITGQTLYVDGGMSA